MLLPKPAWPICPCVSDAEPSLMWNPALKSGTWGIHADWWSGIIYHNALLNNRVTGNKMDVSKRESCGLALSSREMQSTRPWLRRKPIMSKTCLMRLNILNWIINVTNEISDASEWIWMWTEAPVIFPHQRDNNAQLVSCSFLSSPAPVSWHFALTGWWCQRSGPSLLRHTISGNALRLVF